MDPQVLAEMEKLARQKAIIRHLESSNGQNMNHEMLTAGPNKGQRAGGAYGIVPNSLKDFANQSMNRNIGVDPEILVEMDKPHEEVTKALNERRELDEKAAEMALRLINMKTGGDEEKTAYAWRTGHNQSDEKLQKGVEEHPYVRAYRQQREQIAAQPSGVDRKLSSEIPDRIRRMLGLQ